MTTNYTRYACYSGYDMTDQCLVETFTCHLITIINGGVVRVIGPAIVSHQTLLTDPLRQWLLLL